MNDLLSTSIGWLRAIGFFEGISLILLLFVAMPLKYYWDQPGMVKSVGMAHGVLFLLFVGAVIVVSLRKNWPFWSRTLPIIISSFIPFGTFYMDAKVLSKL